MIINQPQLCRGPWWARREVSWLQLNVPPVGGIILEVNRVRESRTWPEVWRMRGGMCPGIWQGWKYSLHEWLVISHTWFQPGSRPGLSLTPSLPQDKQYKREKTFWGHLEIRHSSNDKGRKEHPSQERDLGAGPAQPWPPGLSPWCKSALATYSLSGFRDWGFVLEVLYPAISPD